MLRSFLTISLMLLAIPAVSWLLGSCRKQHPPRGLERLEQEIPDSFPAPLHRFANNPLTEEGFELGRRLFYEPVLSADNLTPCSSCHQQVAAFGTFEHDRSHGVFGSHTLRNAPPLFNLAWSPTFHWDGTFNSLETEAYHPLTGSLEMGESLQNILDKLEADRFYRREFEKVFGYPSIRPEFITMALAQFTGSLVSANSKYDRFKKGEADFSTAELNGYRLFQSHCATCHPEPLFTDYSYRNIGLPVDPLLNDFGRMLATGRKEDSLRFKVPSLRNVALSSNYMHDGRFATLQQCLNHYRQQVQGSITLDPLLAGGIPLTNTEVSELIAFMRTLTDSAFIQNSRFSRPN